MKKNKWTFFAVISVVLLLAIVIGIVGSMNIDFKSVGPEFEQVNPVIVYQPLDTKEATSFIMPSQEKIDKELTEKLDRMGEDDLIMVAIWIGGEEANVLDSENVYGDLRFGANYNDMYVKKEQPVVDFLKAKNAQIIYQSLYAPLVYAKVNKGHVENLEARSDVTSISLDREASLSSNPQLNIREDLGYSEGGLPITMSGNESLGCMDELRGK